MARILSDLAHDRGVVKGTQGDDPKYLKLATTLKHFAVNNQEMGRRGLSATVSERMLMEYYLPHFKAGIVEGKATSIMSSYNAINGTINTENPLLLKDILRGMWKFDGFVVPDSGAVQDMVTAYKKYATNEEATAKAILAGSDLDNGAFPPAIPGAIAQGFMKESDVDQSLRRVLKVRFRLGEFDPPAMVPYTKIPATVIDSHRDLALRAARESITLLTNKNGFLPLDKTKIKTVAVIGPRASAAYTGLGYTGVASTFVVPLDGIKSHVAPGTDVLASRAHPLPGARGGGGAAARRGGRRVAPGAAGAPNRRRIPRWRMPKRWRRPSARTSRCCLSAPAPRSKRKAWTARISACRRLRKNW